MQRLLCILSGISLAIFIFSLSADVSAKQGFITKLIESGSSRSFTRSSSTPAESTDGNAQSRPAPPDDSKGDETKTTLTVTPVNELASLHPSQATNLSVVEQQIFNHISANDALSVEQEEDEWHISVHGQRALWLADFMTGSNNFIEYLTQNQEMLFIPEFFGTTLATLVGATTAAEADTGTLIWIEVPVQGAGASPQNVQLTIQFFTNNDNLPQMDLFPTHLSAATGMVVIATATNHENIATDTLKSLTQRGLRVRRDSQSEIYHVVGTIDGQPAGKQREGGFQGPGMRAEVGGGNTEAMALMTESLVLNETFSNILQKAQWYDFKMPSSANLW